MNCLFCSSTKISASFLPPTHFNQKQFDYLCCDDCELHFIHPIPNESDLMALYPPSYQSGVDRSIIDPSQPMLGLRFSYDYQIAQIKKFAKGDKLVDFGCGNAHFIVNAAEQDLSFTGVEFNAEHVKVMSKELETQQFYTVDDFLNSKEKVDLIRMSNVLEHFTNPVEMMEKLKEKLNPNGVFMIEGPIEMNFSLAFAFRKFFFKLRGIFSPSYRASHAPTHIIFTNAKNQLDFFSKLGLNCEHFKIKEAAWPFPPSIRSAKGIAKKMMALVALISITFGRLIPSWGNTFIYIGSIK